MKVKLTKTDLPTEGFKKTWICYSEFQPVICKECQKELKNNDICFWCNYYETLICKECEDRGHIHYPIKAFLEKSEKIATHFRVLLNDVGKKEID